MRAQYRQERRRPRRAPQPRRQDGRRRCAGREPADADPAQLQGPDAARPRRSAPTAAAGSPSATARVGARLARPPDTIALSGLAALGGGAEASPRCSRGPRRHATPLPARRRRDRDGARRRGAAAIVDAGLVDAARSGPGPTPAGPRCFTAPFASAARPLGFVDAAGATRRRTWRRSCAGSPLRHALERARRLTIAAPDGYAHRRMVAPPTEHEILDVNRRYHDVAADSYDAKWGISFGEIGHQQVLGKLTKLLGPKPGPFARSLEIGAGTGYFTLNLLQTGVVQAATCTDISPGMLRDARAQRAGARPRGRDRRLRRGRAAVRGRELRPRARPRRPAPPARPRPRASPSSSACSSPAGRCSSPASRRAPATASPPTPSAPRSRLAPLWRKALKARPAPTHHGAPRRARARARGRRRRPRLRPRRPRAPRERPPGFADVRVRGEELLANWFGWFNRTLEASADPKDVPWGWIKYAYRGYILLQRVDRALLEPRLPPRIFYNLMLAARKPG